PPHAPDPQSGGSATVDSTSPSGLSADTSDFPGPLGGAPTAIASHGDPTGHSSRATGGPLEAPHWPAAQAEAAAAAASAADAEAVVDAAEPVEIRARKGQAEAATGAAAAAATA